jgi:riboflavin transporter FmnP
LVKEVKTSKLTGTAILAALVIVFDYTLKFSGLKIPFPWMPFLKFDFTGVPIVISFLLFGTSSSAITSTIACLGIVIRSGDLIGGVMKGIAEFSTVLGMALGLRLMGQFKTGSRSTKVISVIHGVLLRILSMSVWNLIVLPYAYGLPLNAVVGMLPLLGVFNGIQGTITASIGHMLYEAYTRNVSTQARS